MSQTELADWQGCSSFDPISLANVVLIKKHCAVHDCSTCTCSLSRSFRSSVCMSNDVFCFHPKNKTRLDWMPPFSFLRRQSEKCAKNIFRPANLSDSLKISWLGPARIHEATFSLKPSFCYIAPLLALVVQDSMVSI